VEYVDILKENEEGFMIRVTKIFDGYEKIIEESISRHLFELCLKTGYIYAMKEAASVA
jgi:hypothetical protein